MRLSATPTSKLLIYLRKQRVCKARQLLSAASEKKSITPSLPLASSADTIPLLFHPHKEKLSMDVIFRRGLAGVMVTLLLAAAQAQPPAQPSSAQSSQPAAMTQDQQPMASAMI